MKLKTVRWLFVGNASVYFGLATIGIVQLLSQTPFLAAFVAIVLFGVTINLVPTAAILVERGYRATLMEADE